MLWHIVKFRFEPTVTDNERVAFEDRLWSLADTIPSLRLVRVARAVGEPDVTGLLTGFDDEEGLAVYRDHPTHQPVLATALELCSDVTRLDVHTRDDGRLPLLPEQE